jgi:hypothetical protein
MADPQVIRHAPPDIPGYTPTPPPAEEGGIEGFDVNVPQPFILDPRSPYAPETGTLIDPRALSGRTPVSRAPGPATSSQKRADRAAESMLAAQQRLEVGGQVGDANYNGVGLDGSYQDPAPRPVSAGGPVRPGPGPANGQNWGQRPSIRQASPVPIAPAIPAPTHVVTFERPDFGTTQAYFHVARLHENVLILGYDTRYQQGAMFLPAVGALDLDVDVHELPEVFRADVLYAFPFLAFQVVLLGLRESYPKPGREAPQPQYQ